MTKSLSAGLLAHIAQEVTTLATCWKITRADGTVYGFTNHDEDITYDGVTYLASTGFTPTAAETTALLNTDDMEVEGLLDAAGIDEDELRAGYWDHARVEMFYINWSDTSQGIMRLRVGWIGNVTIDGKGRFVAELRGFMQILQQPIGRVYQPGCNADLGDAQCGVSLDAWRANGTVVSVSSNRRFVSSLSAYASPASWIDEDGQFDFGLLTWLTGNNAGLSSEVKRYRYGWDFELFVSMPYNVQAGDTFRVSAGCDKTFATCGTKFGNSVNFRGFPHVPTVDEVVRGPIG